MDDQLQTNKGGDLESHQLHALTAFSPRPFRFLDLLPEVRNNIYAIIILIVEKRKITFLGAVSVKSLGQNYGRGYRSIKALKVRIFLVSRQVYMEASAIFYSKNLFTGTRLDAVAPLFRVPLDTDF